MKIHKIICLMSVIAMVAGTAGCSAGTGDFTNLSPSEGIGFAGDSAGSSAKSEGKDDTAAVTDKKEGDSTAADKTDGDTIGIIEGFADEAVAADDTAAEKAFTNSEKTEDTTDFDFEEIYAEEIMGDIEKPSGETVQEQIPEAGQLTAGEWNDNDNWGFFTNLVNSGTIDFPSYGIDPRYRTMVTVKAEDGSPIVNAKAKLLDSEGNVIWNSVTNKKGIAYLFSDNGIDLSAVEIESGNQKQDFKLESSKSNGQSENITSENNLEVTFKGESKNYKNTDIMFIVDSTGSMSDEMLFLQSEFTAITKEIGTENTRYSVNFYRDEGDEYVTKCYDFTDNVSDLQSKLNSESAAGGGDVPEAVADILNETMSGEGWSEDSVKLAFLIFDAPPHEDTQQVILSAVKKASEKGIRIIPVVSSNSERDTELFARALSITTGGTYVFLTDDSGIGDSHLEPIIGDYKVEKLYDVIIRIINDYKQ